MISDPHFENSLTFVKDAGLSQRVEYFDGAWIIAQKFAVQGKFINKYL